MVFTNQSVIAAEKGNAFPLGARFANGCLDVAISVPGGEWCRVLVREYITGKGYGSWTRYELQPAPVFTGIFTGHIKLESKKRYEYIFENADGYFLDERATKINHNEKFGGFLGEYPEKPNSDVIKILSDTMGLTCLASDTVFNWGDDCQPNYDYSDMILYKLHIRGFTIHASSGVKHPGSYKGVTEKITYLKNLGVNGIILQPCVEFNELMDYGLNIGAEISQDMYRSRFRPYSCKVFSSRINYWGYGAQSSYFAPKSSYASEPDNAVNEFKDMVKKLHNAGVEVIMEMDYSRETEPSFIVDNLIFWVREYHIDGFRINVDQIPVSLVLNNPYLCNIKIIGRSFDNELVSNIKNQKNRHIAMANDAFATTMRRFLKGDEGQLQTVSELVINNGGKVAQINYIADHDGFTLNDIYCYDERHNEANGERNRDGRDANYSWNCGTEGPTKKRKILDLRTKMIKNALTALICSQGTPMICAGDEFGNTHFGNNNPYCCDNEQGWVVWDKTKRGTELRSFVRNLISIRMTSKLLHRKDLLSSRDYLQKGLPDVSLHGTSAWYPDFSYYARTLGVFLYHGYAENETSSIYVLFNMHWDEHEYSLPEATKFDWALLSASCPENEIKKFKEDSVVVPPRSILVYKAEQKIEENKAENNAENQELAETKVAENNAENQELVETKVAENKAENQKLLATEVAENKAKAQDFFEENECDKRVLGKQEKQAKKNTDSKIIISVKEE